MNKTILITGATDGIGLATAITLAELGHELILHGRSDTKLAAAKQQVMAVENHGSVTTYKADLSDLRQVVALASDIQLAFPHIDVIINNAGVYVVPETRTIDGLDVRFVVNTIAPYLLTKQLMTCLSASSRVVNLSSAAQAPISEQELTQPSLLSDGVVYARSKLALTMWSRAMAKIYKDTNVIAVNPASMLGSKMVKQAYGVAGGDVQRGADVLVSAALSEQFAEASGLYFDNDIGQFTSPHRDALDDNKVSALMSVLDDIIAPFL